MPNTVDQSQKTPPSVSLLAGAIAGGVEAASTYPFEFAKTRVQLREKKGVPTPRNPFKVVTQVLRDEGVRAIYKGCSSLVVGSLAKDGVRFLSYDVRRSLLISLKSRSYSHFEMVGFMYLECHPSHKLPLQ